MYASPLTWVLTNPVGTPDRDAVIVAYRHAQRLLTITGICLCIPLIAFALVLRNPHLPDLQSLPDAERYAKERSNSSDEDVNH